MGVREIEAMAVELYETTDVTIISQSPSFIKYAVDELDRVKWLYANRDLVGGLKFVEEPPVLRFFMGRLAPVSDWPEYNDKLNKVIETCNTHRERMFYALSGLEKLFPSIMEGLGEDVRNKPFIDILNRLEKLSIIDSADKWLSIREIRNIVTHEYLDNEEEIADGLNQLFREAYYLSSILDKLTEYIISRKLLE